MRALVLAVSVALFATPVAFAQQMYWTEKGNNKIHRANLDGSFVEDLVEPRASAKPQDIALDVVDRKMYWADSWADLGAGAMLRMADCWVMPMHGITITSAW